MLVLSRKVDERIVVTHPHGELIVVVTAIRGDKVRIGFEAPKDHIILRSEVPPRVSPPLHLES